MTEIVQANNIQTLSTLISSNIEIQLSLIILVVGLIIIFSIYSKFSQWIGRLKFSYTGPHFSRFIRKIILPFFALALVSTVNVYIQIFESFDKSQLTSSSMGIAEETLVKILNIFEILVIGYTVSQVIPIILRKKEKSDLLKEDYDIWKSKRGFLMNVHELETAVRLRLPIMIIIWCDKEYGLISLKQIDEFGKKAFTEFNNPDFVALSRSFGAIGYAVKSTEELPAILESAKQSKNTPVIISIVVDYSRNQILLHDDFIG